MQFGSNPERNNKPREVALLKCASFSSLSSSSSSMNPFFLLRYILQYKSNAMALGLLIISDHLRCRFVHLDLRAHLLQARSKRFNLLLLVRGSRLEVLLLLRHRRL
jgi:hypothetical protein